jgi:hypothetical protein
MKRPGSRWKHQSGNESPRRDRPTLAGLIAWELGATHASRRQAHASLSIPTRRAEAIIAAQKAARPKDSNYLTQAAAFTE